MKAGGQAHRQVDFRDRAGGDAARIEQPAFALACGLVVQEGDDVAVILHCRAVARAELRLAAVVFGAELEALDLARRGVPLHQAHEAHRHFVVVETVAVDVAAGPAVEARVDHAEFADVWRHRLLGSPAAFQVEAVAVQMRIDAVVVHHAVEFGRALGIVGEGTVELEGFHDDAPVVAFAFLPGVGRMVDVAGFGLEPLHVLCVPEARQDAEARGHAGVPVGLPAPGPRGFHVLEHRQVHQDRIVLGDRHVVRQARAGQVDRNVVLERAVGGDHAVGHERLLDAVVEEHQVPGALVDLDVGRHLGLELAAEVVRAAGRQGHGVEAVRYAAQVPGGDQRALVKFDIGVGGVLERLLAALAIGALADAAPDRLAGGLLLRQRAGAHVAIAIRGGTALEADCVQHAVAVEPVVAALGAQVRVGAIAHVDATEVRWDRAFDPQGCGRKRGFVAYRGE